METRGVRVQNFDANKGKTLLPWRCKSVAGQQLRTILIRHVLSSNLHLKCGKAGSPKLWDDMVEQLKKEPEFGQHITFETVPVSGRNLKDQYKPILSDRASHHGWTDKNGGVTGNLSGHEGDLDELDRNIRQILMDLEEKKERKEAEASIRADLEKKEEAVLSGETRRQAQASRNKRKESHSSSGGSNSDSSAGSP